MADKEDISKLFLESFLKRALSEIAIKNNVLERKRIEKIKEKINVYQSKNEFFPDVSEEVNYEPELPIQNPIEIQEMTKSIFESEENNVLPPVPRPPINKPLPTSNIPKRQEEMTKSIFESQSNRQEIEISGSRMLPPVPRPPINKPLPTSNIPRKQFFPQRAPNKPIMNPTRPTLIQNNQVKGDFTPSIGINVVNEDFTGLPSIDKILQDEEVKTIECPGPNKQVLVYKGGKIQAANLTLTGDEINNVMNNFSKKSRIPIGSGFFKAAIGPFLITSVMSEFVGTRFIIQRKPKAPGPSS